MHSGERTLFKLILIFGFVGYGYVASAQGNECTWQDWNNEDKQCPEGTQEVFMEKHAENLEFSRRRCCPSGSTSFHQENSTVLGCRLTYCAPSITTDPCSTLDPRFVQGTQVEYAEVLRDICTRSVTGLTEVVGLCCVPNSLEEMLATRARAENHEFPFIAKLKLPNNAHCGAAIYNGRFLITAASCVLDKTEPKHVGQIEVVVGTNLGDVVLEENVYKVKRVVPHEEYSYINDQHFNNIALVELDREIKFGDFVKTVEIAPKDFKPIDYADKAIIAGWGGTSRNEPFPHLQKADAVIRDDKLCFSSSVEEPWGESLLCLGGFRDANHSPTSGPGASIAICRGRDDGKAVLCGVTSHDWNDTRCSQNKEVRCPITVHTEISYFNDWIQKVAGELNYKNTYRPYVYGRVLPKNIDAFEHEVQITSDEEGKQCSGSLIARDFVVTAASCVVTDTKKSREGLKVVTRKGDTLGIKAMQILPGFGRGNDQLDPEGSPDYFYKNNLAVLKLDGEVKGVPDNEIMVIPTTTEPEIKFALELSRLRNTSRNWGEMVLNEYRILDQNECQRRMMRLAQIMKLEPEPLCGVEVFSGGSRCDRELGGSLICARNQEQRPTLCGIRVLHGCSFTFPNGFINIAQFNEWINKAMKQM